MLIDNMRFLATCEIFSQFKGPLELRKISDVAKNAILEKLLQ